LLAAKDGEDFDLEHETYSAFSRKSVNVDYFVPKDKPTHASFISDMHHALKLNNLASSATTADDSVMHPWRHSPLTACFNNLADGDKSALALSASCSPQNLNTSVSCQTNTAGQVNAFQSKAFYRTPAELALTPGAAWGAPDLDELVLLKQRLGQALTTKNDASAKPDHVVASGRKYTNEDLSTLLNKLRQAISSLKPVHAPCRTVTGSP